MGEIDMTRAETIAIEYLKEANGDYRRALIEIAKNYALTLAWLEQAERKAAERFGVESTARPDIRGHLQM